LVLNFVYQYYLVVSLWQKVRFDVRKSLIPPHVVDWFLEIPCVRPGALDGVDPISVDRCR
jgi:hypothetical protein